MYNNTHAPIFVENTNKIRIMKKKPLLIAMIIVCSFQTAVAQDSISTRVWDLASCIDYALEQNIQI